MVSQLCLGARPRYGLVVDEDLKKPNTQNSLTPSLFNFQNLSS